MKWILAVGCAAVLLPSARAAEPANNNTNSAATMDIPGLKDQREKLSYSIGMNIGNNLKRGNYDIDLKVLNGAIDDVLAGRDLKMTEPQAREILMAHQKEQAAKREEERRKTAEKNRAEGDKFLAENKKKEAVKTHEVKIAEGKTAEMQYKVIKDGTGATPKSNDVVTVNYRGTLIDGKEFDSSAKRGQPAKFPVMRVVRGWTEALQMMKVGSKWELYLPSSLAYGDYGYGTNIAPGSALIFEMELVGTEAQQPPAAQQQQQPLTSDIIRVPSAEELKKGAKIEVLKPDEAEKRAKEEAQKNKK